MSWDKNTINCSHMDAIIRTLDNNGIPYTLSLLGAVKAMGINDEHNGIQSYSIRKLEYNNIVILEQINRTSDCDLHDYIHDYEFQKGQEPENWRLETLDSENENWAGDEDVMGFEEIGNEEEEI